MEAYVAHVQTQDPLFNTAFNNWASRNVIRFNPADLNEQFKKVKAAKKSLNDIVDEIASKDSKQKQGKGKRIDLALSSFDSSVHILNTSLLKSIEGHEHSSEGPSAEKSKSPIRASSDSNKQQGLIKNLNITNPKLKQNSESPLAAGKRKKPKTKLSTTK
eukprot:TRINITY_DN7870_c0_g2_i2.p1 TRINITY_DN7870_c0_g2~~TRINITY_DN7870_c0_g2_i2.p1  ORF type:complete len:160 (-),score=17.53 TRINITY_DN7870_c0_g2_i2:78-557(-)